jgi:hypothetical protein
MVESRGPARDGSSDEEGFTRDITNSGKMVSLAGLRTKKPRRSLGTVAVGLDLGVIVGHPGRRGRRWHFSRFWLQAAANPNSR